MAIETVDARILSKLAEYDSATVQNAGIVARGGYVGAEMDYSGPGLARMVGSGVVVGYAVTGELSPITEPESYLDWNEFHDQIMYADAPVIVVLKDADPVPGRGAIIGDGMAYRFTAMGAVGAVVDGNARDVPGIEKAGLDLWATGKVPGHGPFHLLRHSGPVDIRGLKVSQGDILVCDGDGVTRVAIEDAKAVVEACMDVRGRESSAHDKFSRPISMGEYKDWKKESS